MSLTSSLTLCIKIYNSFWVATSWQAALVLHPKEQDGQDTSRSTLTILESARCSIRKEMDFQKSRHENLDLPLCLALRNDLFYLRKLHGKGSFEIHRQVDEGKTVKLILKKLEGFGQDSFALGQIQWRDVVTTLKKGRFTQNLGNVVTMVTDSGLPKEDSPYSFYSI
jgi:hypothetical protein